MTRAGMVLPNVLYIGLARAGSTWLSEALRHHPDVHVPGVKDIYFFDREYGRGLAWYSQFFRAGANKQVRIEFSHDYFHIPFVPERVAAELEDPRLILNLREPVSWVLSNYHNMRRNGATRESIGWVMSHHIGLVASGLYAAYLEHWLSVFSREQIVITLYDDLVRDPVRFINDLCRELQLPPSRLTPELATPINTSAEARWPLAARALRAGGQAARRMGGAELVGRVKRSRSLARILYRPSRASTELDQEIELSLRRFFNDDVMRLSELVGQDLATVWGY